MHALRSVSVQREAPQHGRGLVGRQRTPARVPRDSDHVCKMTTLRPQELGIRRLDERAASQQQEVAAVHSAGDRAVTPAVVAQA